MALLSKTLDGADMNQQLTITETFNNEPFPSAVNGVLKVKDEQGSVWNFNYKVRSKNRRFFSGQWEQFRLNNCVQVGNRVAIDRNDAWCSEKAYKIEVIRT